MATIGVDLRPLQGLHRYRGIGVYVSQLMRAISKLDTDDHFIFYMFAPYKDALKHLKLAPGLSYDVSVVDAKIKNETIYKFFYSWRTFAPIQDNDLDVFLQPDISFGVAPNKIPTVSVFYDGILTKYRDHHLDRKLVEVVKTEGLKAALAYRMNRRVYLKGIGRYQLSSRVLSISQSSKSDLLTMINYSEHKITVTPLAATDEYHTYNQDQIDKTLASLGISKPYVLYIGGADYRKNVSDALDAFSTALATQSDLELVLVGRDFEPQKLYKNKELQKRVTILGSSVHCVGFGKDEDLPKLYAGARAFLFPSLYEGFGIPVLEAMRSGCPVVAYANSSIPEIVQGSFELANTKEQYNALLLKVLSDEAYVARSTLAAQIASDIYSWKLTAEQTLQQLKEVINESIS